MCGPITQDEYRAGFNNDKIIGEFTRPDAPNALLVEDSVGDVVAVLSEDGLETETFWLAAVGYFRTTSQQRVAGRAFMREHGYTLLDPTTQAPSSMTAPRGDQQPVETTEAIATLLLLEDDDEPLLSASLF